MSEMHCTAWIHCDPKDFEALHPHLRVKSQKKNGFFR